MEYDKLFELAKPYLEKNDFGVAHTKRVFDIAKQTFQINQEIENLTFTSIILHDIGGSSIKDQYEKGPQITAIVLTKLGYLDEFIRQVCEIIRTHHDHPSNPSESFKILYDSDKIAMFSKEEYPHHNSRKNFNWNQIVALIYSKEARQLAKHLLAQRRKEEEKGPKHNGD
jgi:HD superfamily phosphohydrolase YqeK